MKRFYYLPSGWTDGGFSSAQIQQTAGGSGQDLYTDNVNLELNFGSMYRALRLNYADLGGNENLTVNGDLRNVSALGSLHGTTVGGALVSTVTEPLGRGVLELVGDISSFSIGGQSLWIDDVCIERMLFGDGFESGDCTRWSMMVP